MRRRKHPNPEDEDLSDPAQRLAQPLSEAQTDEVETAPNDDEAELGEPGKPPKRDVGDLYGVHMPPASDRDLGEDSTLGESFFEQLGEHSAEGGPEVEHEIDVLDDSDDHHAHHPTESGDRPVADKGSGGPGGL